MQKSKILLLIVVLLIAVNIYLFGLEQYLTIAFFKTQQAKVYLYYQINPWQTILLYSLIYIGVTALSLPGAMLMTICGGAIFGLIVGTLVVSFSSSIGATLAFLVSRFLLRNIVQNSFGTHLQTINAGMQKDGVFYLFALRLTPILPFFIINLLMGITSIRVLTFYSVSQAGMLAATIVYVNAGTQLAQIKSADDILTLELILSFAILGVLPLITKKIVVLIKAQN